ncbi:MAG: BACON domain-containing protein [Paraprevotella sp.]|nr:BACON domain-containing protein [Paraprevotella sp.]
MEYRKKEGTFDIGLPESGLLVYRINPAYTGGNVNYNGTTSLDEVYIFRPGGTTTADGNIEQAAFSAESGRTAFGGDADVKPFYSDGTVARFALTNISSCGETLSFDLENLGHQIKLSEDTLVLNGAIGSKQEITVEADVDWAVSDVPDWLQVTPTEGQAGKTTVTVEARSENATVQTREAVLSFTSPSDGSLKSVMKVQQQSHVILPPSDLSAQTQNGEILLTWTAPQTGELLLSDGFEDTSNPNQWTIQNAGDRGWTWQESEKNHQPYSGNYSMYMNVSYDHQDERLTSPVFAYGRELSFYSKSIAPQKTIQDQFYYVEVSTDGGDTWTPVYDLIKDCQTLNKYVKITVNLSAYQSDRMRISFHAYDTNDVGLSYWWQIDDVNIYAAPSGSDATVEGYAVYRNGVKIGEAKETTYADAAPVAGENLYTVRAVGTFGETSDSNPVVVDLDPSGVTSAEDEVRKVEATVSGDRLTVCCGEKLRTVRLISASGVSAGLWRPDGNVGVFDVSGLSRGVYLVVCETEGESVPVVRKVILH